MRALSYCDSINESSLILSELISSSQFQLFSPFWRVVKMRKYLVETWMVWWSARLEVGNWNWTFSAGSSRNKYVCSRTLTAHPGQTSGHKMIADTTTTPFDNEITVCRSRFEKSDSRARKFSHCCAWTLGLFSVPKKFYNHLQYVFFKYLALVTSILR